jgi:hypothetical protein
MTDAHNEPSVADPRTRGPAQARSTLRKRVPALQNGEKVTKPQVGDSSGAALVARLRAEMDDEELEPDAKEVELLSIAEALQDRIVDLESLIESEGLSNTSKSGVVHLNPAVGEARQTRASLARVISQSQLHDDGKDPVKQRAANARWRAHNDSRRQSRG